MGVRKDGVPKVTWTPTVFENELLELDIHLINSRPCHPQTNGKLERFRRTLETEVSRHDSLADFIIYYHERRLHWSLDIDNRQTPLKAFHDKSAYETIITDNPNSVSTILLIRYCYISIWPCVWYFKAAQDVRQQPWFCIV